MGVNQISVFLENKPGTLENMTGILASHDIEMRALSLAETKDFGIARMIVDDVYETMTVLKDSGLVCSLTPVVAAKIPDEAGGLHKILMAFKEAGINVEYMYAFLGGTTKEAYMIFRVQDVKAADKVMTENEIATVSQEELSEL
jgi:hypothetical protein